MIKKLTRIGDEVALLLDADGLRLMKLYAGMLVHVAMEGNRIVVREAMDEDIERERKFQEAVQNVNEKYAETFRRLAEE